MRFLRRYIGMGLVILITFFLGILAGDIPLSYSKEDMKSMAEKVGVTAQAFYTTGSDQVYYQIGRNLKALDEIINMVEKAKSLDEVINPVVDKLEEITISYEHISNLRPQIEEELRGKVEEFQNLLKKSKDQIKILEDEKSGLEEELKELSLEQDEEVKKVKRRSLSMQVEFKTKEIQIWREFVSLEDKIYETIKDADQTIKKFLLVLSENAKVYRGALEVVKLQRDIKSLANFMSLQQLSDELISTWQDLHCLIELLTQEVNRLPAFQE